MTEPITDAEQLAQALARIDKTLRRMDAPPQQGPHFVSANVHANAGGIGLWVCVTCVLVMFVVIILQAHDKARMGEDIRELRQDYDEMQAYLNAIYQQAPHLRPKREGGNNE